MPPATSNFTARLLVGALACALAAGTGRSAPASRQAGSQAGSLAVAQGGVRPEKDRYVFKLAPSPRARSAGEPANRPTDGGAGTSAAKPAVGDAGRGTAEATDGGADEELFSGRLVVFFVPDTDRWAAVEPIDGPFFFRPQPTASIAVVDVKAGGEVVLQPDASIPSTHDLDGLSGRWRVQAVLDVDFTARGHLGPNNLVSEVVSVELAPDRRDEVAVTLQKRVKLEAPPTAEGVEWVERRSDMLSRHFGRETTLRAGVVLPFGYNDLAFPRRIWPTIYVIGGFGANHLDAAADAAMLRAPEARGAIPQAVWIYLDADTPWGHSGFCDSETNGPIGEALVREFIPFLEERFRLISRTDARVVTGHSSGGWTALHLALTYPDTFGHCFASAPDPVDFTAFQRSNLYVDASLHVGRDGAETPSFRSILGPEDDFVHMTVREERMTEHAIDPNGRSGQQWAAWEAMWSPFDPARNAPRRIADPETGVIDVVTAEAWSRHDIARRFERARETLGPIFLERIRLLCGTRDSFYLNEAVARLKAKVDAWRATLPADRGAAKEHGYIELIDGLDHDSMASVAALRFHREIAVALAEAGHAERPTDPTWAPLRPEGRGRPSPAPPAPASPSGR